MSVVCGVAAYFTLPDYPHSKTGSQKWTMDQNMRRLAEARMVADRVTRSTGKGSVFGGVKLCVLDPKTYIFASTSVIVSCTFQDLTPTSQIFLNLFQRPVVVINDFKEQQDILVRRSKEFGKPNLRRLSVYLLLTIC